MVVEVEKGRGKEPKKCDGKRNRNLERKKVRERKKKAGEAGKKVYDSNRVSCWELAKSGYAIETIFR